MINHTNYVNSRIDQMDENLVESLLLELLTELYEDVGAELNAMDMKRICTRVSENLYTKYKGWVWGSVARMFERGLSEEFGKWQRIHVKLLLSWMRQTEEGLRIEKSRHNQQEEEWHKKKAPHIYAENSQRYGKWIRSNLQKKKGENWESLEEYESKMKSKIKHY